MAQNPVGDIAVGVLLTQHQWPFWNGLIVLAEWGQSNWPKMQTQPMTEGGVCVIQKSLGKKKKVCFCCNSIITHHCQLTITFHL